MIKKYSLIRPNQRDHSLKLGRKFNFFNTSEASELLRGETESEALHTQYQSYK